MLSIVNRNVILYSKVVATIQMSVYFRALSQDFRCQLTATGVPDPSLTIASEITVDQLLIAGGTSGTSYLARDTHSP
jgi:hypothetical protein